MNIFAISSVLGILSIFTGSMMFPAYIVALLYNEGDVGPIFISALIAIALGLPLWWFCRKHTDLTVKDGFIIVSFGWVLVCSLSTLPFIIHGSIPSFTDSFFEMMSGYTTTGATILPNIELLPHGLLFWRSFTHLLGGGGFIMITIFLLPFRAMGGMYLYQGEADPGQVITKEKFNLRVKGIAIWLWIIYLALVILNAFLLWVGGMPIFDALCHAFGTVSTAGYSPKNASIGHYNNAYFDWVTILFMFLGGMTFILYYQLLKGDWESVKINTEFRWYLGLTLIFCMLVSWILWMENTYSGSESIRYGTFQIVSLLTTTGFTTANYEQWPQAAQMFIFIVFFIGASAGSTTSGIKIIHYVILLKYLYAIIKKMMQPLQVIPIRINQRAIDSKIVDLAICYFIINIIWVLVGGGVMVILDEMDYFSSLCSVIATLMNIGPTFGEIGPTNNFYDISASGKWFLSLSMLTGRLEMFSVIVLFYPSFWRE